MANPQPIALVGSTVQHNNLTLTPGPGSPDVSVQGQAAWRAFDDQNDCTAAVTGPPPAAGATATPAATGTPAPPPSHGTEICYVGSFSVLINNRMSVRQGDALLGADAPNVVTVGDSTVMIGDIPFGLADSRNLDAFCDEFRNIIDNWLSLTSDERLDGLAGAINPQLAKSGLPEVIIEPTALPPNVMGLADSAGWGLEIEATLFGSGALTQQQKQDLGKSISHEARHMEQAYAAARYVASLPGATAADISTELGIPLSVAEAAMDDPAPLGTQVGVYGQVMYETFFGSLSSYTSQVVADATANTNSYTFPRYANLPSEADAFGAMTQGCGY